MHRRIDLPAQPLGIELGQFLAQRGNAPGRGILVVAVPDRLDGGLLKRQRRVKVGEALAQVDGLVGHPANDGFLEMGDALCGLHTFSPDAMLDFVVGARHPTQIMCNVTL